FGFREPPALPPGNNNETYEPYTDSVESTERPSNRAADGESIVKPDIEDLAPSHQPNGPSQPVDPANHNSSSTTPPQSQRKDDGETLSEEDLLGIAAANGLS